VARWMSAVGSFLRVIFARERLPPAPAGARLPVKRGALSLLFAPEALPEDPPMKAHGRGRWLAWLFAPERLDP